MHWTISSKGMMHQERRRQLDLAAQHKERSVVVPINDERNSLQFAAKIYMVETMKKEKK